jgi:hypothetical protein
MKSSSFAKNSKNLSYLSLNLTGFVGYEYFRINLLEQKSNNKISQLLQRIEVSSIGSTLLRKQLRNSLAVGISD